MSAAIPNLPFLFPRTISISRANPHDDAGVQDYSGTQADDETPVAANLPARIQADRQGQAPGTKLPADAAGQGIWKIIFKAALGLVQDRDIITDDRGQRYHVISAYWGPLVTTCRCEILEN